MIQPARSTSRLTHGGATALSQLWQEHRIRRRRSKSNGSTKPAEYLASIAILPFVDLSAEKENEYLSDGIAEEIINVLARIPGLKVIARTSAFAFRGKQQDITKIAKALRVARFWKAACARPAVECESTPN